MLSRERAFELTSLVGDHLTEVTGGRLLIALIGHDYRYQFVNAAHYEFFKGHRGTIVGQSVRDIAGENGFLIAKPNLDKALSGEVVFADIDVELNHAGRSQLHMKYIPVRGTDEQIIGVVAVAYDVSDLAEAEQRAEQRAEERTADLARSELRLRAVLETVSDVIIAISTSGTILSCNAAITDLLGYSPEEVLGKSVSLLMLDTDRHEHDGHLSAYARTGLRKIIGVGREVVGRAKSGDQVPLLLQVAETTIEDKTLFVGVLRDIRPERQVQEALRARSELVDQISDAVVATDLDFRITSWNRAAERVYGYRAEEIVGRSIEVLATNMLGTSLEEAQTALSTNGNWLGEVRQQRQDGSWILVQSSVSLTIDAAGNASGAIAANRDITEARRVASELLQAKKMEAVGTLASGVAHDFNNLLMGIIGYASLASDKLAPDHEARKLIDVLRKTALSGREVVEDLMFLGGTAEQEDRATPVLVDKVVERIQTVAARFMTESIKVVTDLRADGVYVGCGEGRLSQLLMNLVTNAKKAMPSGGELVLTSETLQITPSDTRAAPGPYVELSVGDTGIGMNEEVRVRAFDPFFTTRPASEGTGLGLANVYAIVQQCGGHISLQSKPGEGTTVTILLPVAAEPRAATPPPASDHKKHATSILLVEDNLPVRLAVEHYLKNAGYIVEVATSPAEALEISAGKDRPFDLLLTDVLMPLTSGPELARELNSHGSCAHVLFMSAHPKASLVDNHGIDRDANTLQKPFTEVELLSRLDSLFSS